MCDTFVALPPATADGSVIFGKNSDREPNEAQVLEFHPAREYPSGTALTCTYLKIPQARRTHAVLLSRPFWMWGAETGANEKGVVIGNEAVFTKMPRDKTGRLTGMDLLRLALERADTAEGALEVITDLLAEYGQGGPCGYHDKKLIYHNSFLIADPREAWVLETAGHLWAALKIEDVYSISNGLTIGERYDLGHPDLVTTAQKKGWLKRGQTFHFARCYSDWFYTTFSACGSRRSRSCRLIESKIGHFDLPAAFSVLRDHGDAPYRPDNHFLMTRICAHAANPLSRHASQSTASFVANLKPNGSTFWATGTSAPCTGIFKPLWFSGSVVPDIGPPPGGTFNSETLWWQHEQLHRTVLLDFQTRLAAYRPERDKLESDFICRAQNATERDYWNLSQTCFWQAGEATETWFNKVRTRTVINRPKSVYRWYWKHQNRVANIFGEGL